MHISEVQEIWDGHIASALRRLDCATINLSDTHWKHLANPSGRGLWVTQADGTAAFAKPVERIHAFNELLAGQAAKITGHRVPLNRAEKLSDDLFVLVSPVLGEFPQSLEQICRRNRHHDYEEIVSFELSDVIPFMLFMNNTDINTGALIISDQSDGSRISYHCDFSSIQLSKVGKKDTHIRMLTENLADLWDELEFDIKLKPDVMAASVQRIERTTDDQIRDFCAETCEAVPVDEHSVESLLPVLSSRRDQLADIIKTYLARNSNG